MIDIRHKTVSFVKDGAPHNPASWYYNKELLAMKKTRLIEDRVAYEDLAIQDNFSEDETTFEYHRKNIKDRKDKQAIQKIRQIENYMRTVQDVSIQSIKGVIDTVSNIDKNCKKIIYQEFNHDNVNEMARAAPKLIEKVQGLQRATNNPDYKIEIKSDNYESDSSGNYSEMDEVNLLERVRERIGRSELP